MQTRRHFLKNLSLASLAGLTATLPSRASAAPKKLRWRIALAVPKTLPIWGDGVIRFAERVKTMSQGELSIKVYGAGELVPAFGIFDAVKSGSIQMGHGTPYYYQGKVPESPFFSTLPFGMNAAATNAWLMAGGGQELWEELMAPHGIICFACGTPGYQTTGWFTKEINSIADLKGLKIRIPGLASKIYAKAGATPILLPGAEIFTSLSTGVIDAVEWVGPYHDYTMGFQKVAKYLYGGSWHEPGSTLDLMINKQAWESLPAHLQMILRSAAAETNEWMWAQFESKNAEFLAKIKAEGKIQIRNFSREILQQLKVYSDEVIGELANSSPIAKRIYTSYTDFQKGYEAYNRLSVYTFDNA
ncbi:MAG: TRAP transporter substrate-binding protein [Bdellovibrionales bacterium]|nr:TRAP transporter substrate-binding protein [Bdellovibrionales bacterium]